MSMMSQIHAAAHDEVNSFNPLDDPLDDPFDSFDPVEHADRMAKDAAFKAERERAERLTITPEQWEEIERNAQRDEDFAEYYRIITD